MMFFENSLRCFGQLVIMVLDPQMHTTVPVLEQNEIFEGTCLR